MARNIDKELEKAYKQKEQLEKNKSEVAQQIKANNELIKELEKEKRQIQGEEVIKKIEAKGFSVEDILRMMEKEKQE